MSEKKVELNRDADGLVREETQSGIYVKPIYTPEDLKSEKYERDIGDPGVYPFTRGIYPEMFRNRLWLKSFLVSYDTPENTDGLYLTGFVSDSEKRTILQHSTILINPSYYESLSLVVLEALYDKIPVLVNGRCNVLKEHCIFSNGAVRYYMNCRDFRKELETVTADCHLRDRMSAAGRKYYEEYYEWNVVLPRLYEAINNIDIWGTRKL